MAPILSLTKERMDAIRDLNKLSVVKIWQLDAMGSESAPRTGFVLQTYLNSCAVVTVREGLDLGQGIRVQFQSGDIRQGTIHSGQSGQVQSKLVAIILHHLPPELKPLKMAWSAAQAIQCQTVAHIGYFHRDLARLGISNGSVGLVRHTMLPGTQEANKTFIHCCSQKEYMIGAPVFNTNGQSLGINITKKMNKNMFFALDKDEVAKELQKLFGVGWEDLPRLLRMSVGQASGQASGQAKGPAGSKRKRRP